MREYILRRLFLMIPTLFGITILTFVIINLAPGSPVEQRIQQMRFGGGGGEGASKANVVVNSEIVEALNKQYGLDKPILERYGIWLKRIVTLDFGNSFTFEEPVLDVIVRKFPVSLTFGITSFFLLYLISIPLGVMMALNENNWIDRTAGIVLGICFSIPSFMLAILMLVFLAGGAFFNIFPIGGIVGDNYEELSLIAKIWDRIMHFVLPGICYMIGSFTTLTLLMRNSLLEELKKDYIRTAKAKGLPETPIYYKHALRNAFIPIATGLGGFLAVFFGGSILIEQIFSLDGIGLLIFNSLKARDYNVIMALAFLQSVAMLLGNLVSDIIYVFVDPRIDFS